MPSSCRACSPSRKAAAFSPNPAQMRARLHHTVGVRRIFLHWTLPSSVQCLQPESFARLWHRGRVVALRPRGLTPLPLDDAAVGIRVSQDRLPGMDRKFRAAFHEPLGIFDSDRLGIAQPDFVAVKARRVSSGDPLAPLKKYRFLGDEASGIGSDGKRLRRGA